MAVWRNLSAACDRLYGSISGVPDRNNRDNRFPRHGICSRTDRCTYLCFDYFVEDPQIGKGIYNGIQFAFCTVINSRSAAGGTYGVSPVFAVREKNGVKKSFLTKVRNHTNIKVRFRTRRKRDGSETLK